MAQVLQTVSDVSGQPIPAGEEITAKFSGLPATGKDTIIDLSRSEAAELVKGRGRVVSRRGRPAAKASPSAAKTEPGPTVVDKRSGE
jgi:hypothetical protein